MALTSRARSRMTRPVVILLVVLLLPPLLGLGDRTRDSVTLALVFAIAAVGLDVLSGYAGQLSIGNFGFVAVGAYTAAILGGQAGWNLWLTFPAAVVVPMVLATFLGVPMMRLGQIGGAFITYFFGFVVVLLLGVGWLSSVTQGAAGLPVPPASIGTVDLTYGAPLYYFAWLVLAIVALLSARLADSRTGQSLRVIKRSPTVAAALGIGVEREKIVAFAYSAGAAGAAGFVYAQILGYLTPTSFGSTMSLGLLIMTIVGGLGSIAGPIVGAVAMTMLQQVTREAGSTRDLYYAVVLVIVLVAMPEGIFGLGEKVRRLVLARLRAGGVTATPVGAPENSTPTRMPQPARASLSPVPATGGPLLVLDGVEVSFGGVKALDSTQISVARGEIHALLGPNGAGKTTILNCISGLQAYDGSVRFGDVELGRMRAQQIRRLGITRTFQNPSLVGDLSVLENVQLGCYGDESSGIVRDLLPLPSTLRRDARTRDAARAALALVGLPADRWSRPAAATSLADQKLIDIARAVVSSPRMVLLDEPTAGLHDDDIEAVARVLTQVNRESGITILVIAHHVGFLRDIAHRATALNFGRAIATGKPDDVVEDPRVIDVFLGAEHVS